MKPPANKKFKIVVGTATSTTRPAQKISEPSDEEIACHAYAIYAMEHPQHAMELWQQARAQLIADRRHDAGLLEIAPTRSAFGRRLRAHA